MFSKKNKDIFFDSPQHSVAAGDYKEEEAINTHARRNFMFTQRRMRYLKKELMN